MQHSSIAWLTVVLDNRSRSREAPLRARRRRGQARSRVGRATALLACAGALAASSAGAAEAAPLALSDAREAAAALTPLPVEALRCFHHSGDRRRHAPRRALCIVNHPVAEGAACRTFVLVRRRRGGEPRARVLRSAPCTPSLLQPIEP